jgi:hypothetical protein
MSERFPMQSFRQEIDESPKIPGLPHRAASAKVKSQFIRQKNSISGYLEGFSSVSLHDDLDYFPSLSFALNNGTWLGRRFVAVHVQIDLFRSGIFVIPKHDLLGHFHEGASSEASPELSVWRLQLTTENSSDLQRLTATAGPAQIRAATASDTNHL